MVRAAQVGWNGVDRVLTSGKLSKLVIYYIRTESSDWIAAVLGSEKPPNNEQAVWSQNLINNFQLVDYACIFHPTTPGSKSRDLHLPADVPQDIILQLDYFAFGGGPNAFENKKKYGKGKGRGNKIWEETE